MTTPIYVHIDGVRDQLTKLMSHLEEFPTPPEVSENEGSKSGPAAAFSLDLSDTAAVASEATQFMIEELAEAEEAIHAALKDLTQHDEDLSDSADRLTSFVEGAVAQVSGEGMDVSADGGSSSSVGADYGTFGNYS